MEVKEAEYLFSTDYKGDHIMQLKDGKILVYYLYGNFIINVYNEKNFHKLYEIDINLIIQQFEKENNGCSKYKNNNTDKNIIINLDNGLILIGHEHYLIELNLYDKVYDYKIVTYLNDNIIDMTEITNKKMIVITYKNMILVEKENEKYIIKNNHLIKDNWKVTSLFRQNFIPRQFCQNYSIYSLPNNRLLLNSSCTFIRRKGCCLHSPKLCSNSKIIFVDLNNFEEIKLDEIFGKENVFILEKIFIIQDNYDIKIYNINSLEYIKSVRIQNSFYIYKCDERHLIIIQENEKNNFFVVYKNINNDLIEYCKFIMNFYNKERFYKKILILLKNKKIIIGNDKIYLLTLNFD